MSMLHVHFNAAFSCLHAVSYSMSILIVFAACHPCLMLDVHNACSCWICMLHVHAACTRCLYLYVLHVHVYGDVYLYHDTHLHPSKFFFLLLYVSTDTHNRHVSKQYSYFLIIILYHTGNCQYIV